METASHWVWGIGGWFIGMVVGGYCGVRLTVWVIEAEMRGGIEGLRGMARMKFWRREAGRGRRADAEPLGIEDMIDGMEPPMGGMPL